ncbi:MAG: UDP-glucose 4-epimerase GalE [Propionibacteriaceae bacterium]|jgi:UDP-glucose 4-epimerase|nr:UDP-glucose 4-epimerase GalE [Propionibacteriaceae bacterium]
MKVLLTGGAGYIGTHTAIALHDQGHQVVIVDNLANASQEAVKRAEQITGTSMPFYEIDVCQIDALRRVMEATKPDAIIHFAGLKAVGESVAQPLRYYDNNLNSALSLVKVMLECDVQHLVFSSSATVYGDPERLPLTEDCRIGVGITNPYGWTKYMIEQMLRDISLAEPQLAITILRYFNPVGAHPSGLIGEDPLGIPNNLMPFVAQVAGGRRPEVQVFGNDFDTVDGTGVRDYIHVSDLAAGHVAALDHSQPGVSTYNLGSGRGTSVLELIAAFEQACGHTIPYRIVGRRAGDIDSSYCDPELARRLLGWKTEHTIEDACRDSWHWQRLNPMGYISQ